MLTLGCHLSSAKGFLAMGREAVSLHANTFQFFLRNPRGGNAKQIRQEDAAALCELMQSQAITTCLAHAPYTLNPCAQNESTEEFARMVLRDDLERLEQLPCSLYNLHPGSHVGQGREKGIEKTANTLNAVLSVETRAVLLLETMAGQGSEIGVTFEELRDILDRVTDAERMGVCLDTCHAYCAGYDLKRDLDGVMTAFDRYIGLERLRFVHLNDSKYPLGSRRDRHERLGMGELGWDAIARIVKHPALKDIPFCLETPQESMAGYAEEIRMVQELSGQ